MSYVADTLSNLIHQTAFFNLTWGKKPDDRDLQGYSYIFAIAKGFEPLLLVHCICMLLVNIYPDIMANPEDMSTVLVVFFITSTSLMSGVFFLPLSLWV